MANASARFVEHFSESQLDALTKINQPPALDSGQRGQEQNSLEELRPQ